MQVRKKRPEASGRFLIAAFLAGIVNALFGGGGGMVLLPLLGGKSDLRGRELFANSVAVMLPISLISVASAALRSSLPPAEALPYCVGGTLGGMLGGRLFSRMPPQWLRRGFALFLFYAGIRYLL